MIGQVVEKFFPANPDYSPSPSDSYTASCISVLARNHPRALFNVANTSGHAWYEPV